MPWLAAALAMIALGACERRAIAEPATGSDRRALPAPRREGGPPLTETLATRRSERAFGARALDELELAQLLWAAQGITDGRRSAPSAGALYPLTIHVLDARGVWRYVPAEHVMVRESAADQRGAAAAATYAQDATRNAPVLLVITADVAIVARKYGKRAGRFAALEAGHAAQNILLTATSLGLAAVPVGAFDDARLRRAIGAREAVTPLYVIPVGSRP